MAFDRTAINSMYINTPRGKVLKQRATDAELKSAAMANPGILASGWGIQGGGIGRTGGAQPPAGYNPSPQPQPVQPPFGYNPNPPASQVQPPFGYQQPAAPTPTNKAPAPAPAGQAPINVPDYFRVYVRDPKTGKRTIQLRHQSSFTYDQAKKMMNTVGGLNYRKPGAVTPKPGTQAPAVSDSEGYFFNPWSDTLWSKRNADGTIELNASSPGAGSSLLKNMDLDGVRQYRLPGASGGNMMAGMSLADASAFLEMDGARQNLATRLIPGSSKLASLNRDVGGGTMYDVKKRSYLDGWDDNVNMAMSNLAARGMYNGGAKDMAIAAAAKAKSDALLGLDSDYGQLAKQGITGELEDTRRSFGLEMLRALIANMNVNKQNDIAEALG